MVSIEDYGEFETAWCPGCGNFQLREGLKQALANMDLAPHQVLLCSGIGQAAKMPHYIKCNCFNGLHGRSLPPAQGAKMANPDLVVIAESGDGCQYGEGGNHFLAAIRRNMNITMLTHDNQIYGLTKGQASPTTGLGHKTKAQPYGATNQPFNPIATAIGLGAGFVARGFTGETDHLADLIQQAVEYRGFALVDIFQPCVSFNKVNTFKWYKEHVYKTDHDPTNQEQAMEKALELDERIPIGVIFRREDQETLEDRLPLFTGEPLAKKSVDKEALREIMMSWT
jgi:2-oxoglutarate ferredoxin oxidoreductase subunit beta